MNCGLRIADCGLERAFHVVQSAFRNPKSAILLGVLLAELTYRDALRSALIEEMDHDRRVVLIGEGIGVDQGTFRGPADLLLRYGPTRVVDTPISELGFV